MKSQIDLLLVDSLPGLYSLKHEWDGLVSNMEDSSPFCSHEWIFRWAETFLGKNELQIILARKDGELVGFAPLYMTSYYGLRVLQLLGLKEVNGECVSFIIQHELEDVVAPDIFRAIIDLPTRWDAVSFYGIRSNSNMQRLLFVHGLPLMKETKCLTSLLGLARVVNLEGGWDKYLQTCSKKFRKRYKQTSAECIDAGISVLFESEFACHDDIVDRLIDIESRTWQGTEGNPVIRLNERFFRDLLPELIARRSVDVAWAVQQERAIAFVIFFMTGHRAVFYMTGYDTRVSDLSVGTLLHYAAFQRNSTYGINVADFMTDIGESRSKEKWTINCELSLRHIFLKKSVTGRAIGLVSFLMS